MTESLETPQGRLTLAEQPESLGSPLSVRILRVALLAFIDSAVLGCVALAAVGLWAVPVRGQTFGHYLELWPLAGLFVLAFAIAGLYPGFGLGAIETLRRLTASTSFTFVVLAAGSFVLKTPDEYSRVTFLLAWLGLVAFLPTVRYVGLGFFKHLSWWGEPSAIVGEGPLAERTITALRGALTIGYRPSWVLTPSQSDAIEVGGAPVVGSADLAEKLADRGVQVAFVAIESPESSSYWLEHLQRSFRHVIVIRGGRQIQIEGVTVRNLGGILGIEFKNQLLRRRNALAKRAIDIIGASVGLVLAAPIIAVSALAIRLVSRGPVFMTQRRSGVAGREILVLKLRTMYEDADTRLETHLAKDSDAREEWERRFKLTNDPRILPVFGRFLRRFSVDELPQLWNVLRGEMSLVGPRPFPAYHLVNFSAEFLELRSRVRPGVTGLWQVLSRHVGGLREQEDYDTYYIRNWSLWMDAYVIVRTLFAVVSGRGH